MFHTEAGETEPSAAFFQKAGCLRSGEERKLGQFNVVRHFRCVSGGGMGEEGG